jgi:hypothetical protein
MVLALVFLRHRLNKLKRLSPIIYYSQVRPEPTLTLTINKLPVNILLDIKGFPGTNTPAYLSTASMLKKVRLYNINTIKYIE